MRVPPVRRTSRGRFRVRAWMLMLIGLLVVLFLSARGLASFYTDYLWFDSVGFGSTWRGLLWARFAPAAVFTAVFFVMMFASLSIADRIAPRTRVLGPEDEMLARYQQTVGPYAGRLRILVSLIFAFLAGGSVAGEWQRWVLFTHAQDFGIKDPQFHKDVGFFVFRLPFLTFLFDWLFAGLIIVLIVTAIAHYLNGGIRLQSPFHRVTPQVKAHLSVILGLMALVKTAQYYLGRYELNFSARGVVEGASKTDVAAQLPAFNMLMVISIVAAGLFVWNIWRRGWVLPVIAVGLWGFVALVIGTIYPAAYQQFAVQPNELAKERPYIRRNIHATRAAFGLDEIKATRFPFKNNLTQADLLENSGTISNARLWDPTEIATNFQQFQSLQTYYRFNTNADTDRYIVDNQLRQVLISARELNSADLPSQSWVNRHVVYTHGYGAVVSPANSAETSGQPNYLLKDIPGVGSIKLTRPQVYFGEGLGDYTLVGAKQPEFDRPGQGRDAVSRMTGDTGVGLSSLLRKSAFALRFGDLNLLISSQIQDQTRIIFRRDVAERVRTAAPFLTYDDDPYPVISDGHLVWVLDGFTTSDNYPYSQSMTPNEGGAAGQSFNYIRNSVKVTVDAYTGDITYYVVDSTDPIIKAYRAAFPDLFTDLAKMPADVRAHLRYPQNLFSYQTDVYRKYHVTNPSGFFAGAGFWEVSADPASVASTTDAGTVITRVPQNASSSGKRVDPLYVLSKLPGEKTEEFLLLRPFVPVSSGNSQNRLASFMVARADPAAKPRLESLVMPDGLNVAGPVQVNQTINTTDEISKEFSLLNQRGSQVVQGALQIIPVKDSLLYIQPWYVVSENGRQPALRHAIVYYAGQAHFGNSVEEALCQFPQFGPCLGAPAPPTDGTQAPPTTGNATVDQLLEDASAAYDAAQAALAKTPPDLGTYQTKVKELGDILSRLATARATETGSGKKPSTSSTTTTTTRPAGKSGTQALGR